MRRWMKLQYLKFLIGWRGPVTLILFEKHELTLREIYDSFYQM